VLREEWSWRCFEGELPVCMNASGGHTVTRNATPTQTQLRFKVGFCLTSQVVGCLQLLRPYFPRRIDHCL
jgi:hypothetical protein